MRKIVSLISLLLICLAFTSCVDYVQSVTFKNGKYHMYYKVMFLTMERPTVWKFLLSS